MKYRSFLFVSALSTLLLLSVQSLNAQDAKVGFIRSAESHAAAPSTVTLIDNLTEFFPVDTLEHVTLQNTLPDIDAVVDELEAAVNDMKSRGFDKIMIEAFSTHTAPFIEGSAGSLGGIHSDERHPEVTFSAVAQGTSSVDNAQNWYRAGTDQKSSSIMSAPILLPDVAGLDPKPQFILASDFSAAIGPNNATFLTHAETAGYEVVSLNLEWDQETSQFDNIAGLSSAIGNAPPDSRVGVSMSSANIFVPGVGFQTLHQRFTEQALEDENIFDAGNTNVDFLSISWRPTDSLPVDLSFGVSSKTELLVDPDGVNEILVELGFPSDEATATTFNSILYKDFGVMAAMAFAWLATDGEENLDPRYRIDENRQHVHYYLREELRPAGSAAGDFVLANQIINPRWEALELVTDFDDSGVVDAADIDLLCSAIAAMTNDAQFDLNDDGMVESEDLQAFVDSTGLFPGDTDFDGSVSFMDFLSLANAFASNETTTWSDGDFNCDGDVGFMDFLALANNFGITAAEAASVPEPSSALLLFASLTGLMTTRVRRR